MRTALAAGLLTFVAFVVWCGASYFDPSVALALLEHAAFCN